MLHVIGGVYREYCMRPGWQEIYGSAGRAASAIATFGGEATLTTYLAPSCAEVIKSRAALEGYSLRETVVQDAITFSYHHPLSTPTITGVSRQDKPLGVSEQNVIRFGMLEGTAVVDAEYAVYDPQQMGAPESFSANGSKAKHLAIVLNRYEASKLSGIVGDESQMAGAILAKTGAEVVIIKSGPRGALVAESAGRTWVPAFETDNVWKIGSGDCFVAIFGYLWMEKRLPAAEAAATASKATAFYCATQGFASPDRLSSFQPKIIQPGSRYLRGHRPSVYLAGPFFTLGQLWLIEQARDSLRDMGLAVFSPYHDVGHGSADDVVRRDLEGIESSDLVFAIGDGLDSGTIYEIGYARAKDKPVVFYVENESEENKKMMQGSDCTLCTDFTTAIYKTLWTAVAQ